MANIKIDSERCKGCGFCSDFCPKALILLEDRLNVKGYHPAIFKDNGECTGCGFCYLVCPDCAIEVWK